MSIRNIQKHYGELIEVIYKTYDNHAETIEKIAHTIVNAYRHKHKVLIYGNGGSDADASHFAGELEGAYRNRKREPLQVITLSNPATLTAVANDFGYEEIFARNVRANAKKGDIVIGFSTSGESINIIRAFEEARIKEALTVAFTGYTGMNKSKLVDILLDIPSKDTPRIQEVHTFAFHEICEIVEGELYGNGKQR